jgi:DNA-binding CsgD family transcriptional regulator
LRDFQRSDFYAFVHRPLGVEYMLQVYLDPARTDARLEFDRGDRAFDKRDREALCLLLPHVRRFLHAARRRELMPMPQVLTPREQEVLGHVASGGTNAEVAAALGISQNTVRKHLENVYAKLGVHTRTAAVAAIYGKETLTL